MTPFIREPPFSKPHNQFKCLCKKLPKTPKDGLEFLRRSVDDDRAVQIPPDPVSSQPPVGG